jgi:hypothetical protein
MTLLSCIHVLGETWGGGGGGGGKNFFVGGVVSQYFNPGKQYYLFNSFLSYYGS